MYRKPILTLLFLLCWPLLAAVAMATGVIKGTITDASSDEALIGANVIIRGTSIGAATDIDGNYTIPNAPDGTHTLIVTYVGYESVERQVTVVNGRTITENFELAWAGVQGEEVVITAQAEGQMSAINQQLQSNTITNIVSADRIQEIPDVNAAESIGRLPGVSILRSGGEANKIAIRGLSPKYNTVTVNGVRVPTTGAEDRSVDLSLVSSNMLDGIEVMKAITPDRDADAIGGSVDLKLREAPEGFEADITAQGGYNALQDYYGNYKFSGNASNRFFNNRFGIVASFNIDEYNRTADKFDGGYGLQDRLGDGVLVPRITNLRLREDNQIRGRLGGSFVADYRIPAGRIMLNTFYNKLSNDFNVRTNRMDLSRNEIYYSMSQGEGTTSIMTTALSMEQDFNFMRYDVGVSRSRSNRKNPANYYWEFIQPSAFDKSQIDDYGSPQNIPQFALVDTMLTRFQNLDVSTTDAFENESAVQFNATVPYRLGNRFDGYLKAGGKFRWMDRTNDEGTWGRGGLNYGNAEEPRRIFERLAGDSGLVELIEEYGYIPITPFMDSYSRDNFLSGEYPLGFTINPEATKRITEIFQQDDYLQQYPQQDIARDYEGVERYQAGYVMAQLNLGRWLTFMPGIRWEGDYSRYSGTYIREGDNNVNRPPVYWDTTRVRENSFWLPMVHLRVKPTSWLDFRFARTETLTRPDYLQYSPATYINLYGNYIDAGNPNLKPAQATNWDASMSVYQPKVGLFTVSGFYKDIKDLIFQTRFYLLPGQTILPDFVMKGGNASGVPSVDTDLNNPNKATYKGVELDWQTNFWWAPNPFKGIVLSLNYTRIVSETTYPQYLLQQNRIPRPPFFQNVMVDTFRVGRMPNQPSHIANITVGYDFKGFSSRVSFLYQTDTATWIAPEPASDNFTDDYFRVDVSLKQNLYQGLQLFANLNNLNARADRNFQAAVGAYPTYTEYYGFTMDLGVRYRF